MNLISQMMKPRLREAESLAPGHRARIDGPISHSIKQEEHSILPPPQEPEFQPRSGLAVCPWVSSSTSLSLFSALPSGPDRFLPTPRVTHAHTCTHTHAALHRRPGMSTGPRLTGSGRRTSLLPPLSPAGSPTPAAQAALTRSCGSERC